MFELFSDIYFIVYKLYYIDKNNNLDIHVRLRNWDRENMILGEHSMTKPIDRPWILRNMPIYNIKIGATYMPSYLRMLF
jgi:hypothetical protein